MRRGAAALLVAVSALGALVGCGSDPADPVSTYGEGPKPTDDALPVASGRALAAVAIGHLRPDQVDSVGGFVGGAGETVLIRLDGARSTLYLSTISPDYHVARGSCAEERRHLGRRDLLLSCVETSDSLTAVTSSGSGRGHAVLGYRNTDAGRAAAWVEPSFDDDAAQRLVESLLSDSRIGYRTTPEAMALGKDLDQYEDMHVTTSIEQVD
ncbi:hypothetical protein ACFPYL_22545 [Nocardioides hankookensis]|uniref:Secreted protein n=1 Tax=Nocardioides hankookensis TaxID=443157 RepID=A0ABW1LR34_9ACTN